MTGISSSELSSSCAKEANQRRNNNLLHAQTSDAAIMLHASHNGNHRVLLRPVCSLNEMMKAKGKRHAVTYVYSNTTTATAPHVSS